MLWNECQRVTYRVPSSVMHQLTATSRESKNIPMLIGLYVQWGCGGIVEHNISEDFKAGKVECGGLTFVNVVTSLGRGQWLTEWLASTACTRAGGSWYSRADAMACIQVLSGIRIVRQHHQPGDIADWQKMTHHWQTSQQLCEIKKRRTLLSPIWGMIRKF